MFRVLTMWLLTAVLVSCGPDAQEQAARAYADEMAPLLERNAALSRSFLDMAALVKKKKATPQSVANTLKGQMIPRARSLHESAAAIQPTSAPLNGIHMGLVRAWSNRVQAYEAMQLAWESGDLVSFEGAAADHKTVFKAEQRYFETTDKLLGKYQLKLDRYP